jgi:hypothetical protein
MCRDMVVLRIQQKINLLTGDRAGVLSQAAKAAADFVRLPQCACAVPMARSARLRQDDSAERRPLPQP